MHQQLQQVCVEHEEFTKATRLPFPIPLRNAPMSASLPTLNPSQATSMPPSFPLSNSTQASVTASSPPLNSLQPTSASISTSLSSPSSVTPTPSFHGLEWTDFDVGLCVPCSNHEDCVSDSEPKEPCPPSVVQMRRVQTRSCVHAIQALPCSFLIQ